MSRTAIVILAVVCVAAGAGGTFLALRNDAAPVSSAEIETLPAATSSATVAESEDVIEPAPAALPSALQPVTPKARPAQPPPPPRAPVRQVATAPRAPEPPPPPPVVTQDTRSAVPIEPAAISDNRASHSVEPPAPSFEELVVAADSVIGLQLESPVSSERAQVEDSVVARVTREVRVGDRVVIPAGAKAFGEVTLVERGGKVRERARLGVRFTSVVLADGTRLPMRSETIYREGDPRPRKRRKDRWRCDRRSDHRRDSWRCQGRGDRRFDRRWCRLGRGHGRRPQSRDVVSGTPLTVRIEDPIVVTVEK